MAAWSLLAGPSDTPEPRRRCSGPMSRFLHPSAFCSLPAVSHTPAMDEDERLAEELRKANPA